MLMVILSGRLVYMPCMEVCLEVLEEVCGMCSLSFGGSGLVEVPLATYLDLPSANAYLLY